MRVITQSKIKWYETCAVLVLFLLSTAVCAQVSPNKGSPNPAQVPTDPSVRLHESLAKIQADLADIKKTSVAREWTPAGAAVLTALVAIVTLIVSTRNNAKLVRETIAERSREEERKAIRAQVNEFYGPFLQFRNSSRFLYDQAFIPRRTTDERHRYADSEGHFRTLIALIRGHRFQGTDAILLEQIVDIGQKTSDLIYSSIGLVDDPQLQETLARATNHFRLMQLALQKPQEFSDAGTEFDGLTFPSDLDSRVQDKLNSLNERLRALTRSG